MSLRSLHTALRYFIAAVWLANGLLCKVLHLVPRHEQIVARILGGGHAGLLTTAIGGGEILMAGWVLSRVAPRQCAAVQIALVVSMNVLEAFLAPDLLLWGRWNAVFAGLFAALIYYHTFKLLPHALHRSNADAGLAEKPPVCGGRAL